MRRGGRRGQGHQTDWDAALSIAPSRARQRVLAAGPGPLSRSESHCYRMRVDRFMAETRPTFEPDDAQLVPGPLPGRRSEDAFDHFGSSARPTSNTCATCFRSG